MPRILTREGPDSKSRYWEWGGLLALVCLFVFFLITSWRKWTDPLIDFGVQLYAPWRITHGAVLYRDIDYLYGPLSQYFNAALFASFGPGLMVLVVANIMVFVGILAVTYYLCRAAWGAGAALVAVAVFISIFGFSQYVLTANYNYVTPYAHEATHGLLVCLLLVILLVRWVEKTAPGLSFGVGVLLGLTVVLKPEIMLAGGMSLAVAALVKYRLGGRVGASSWLLLLIGAIIPSIAFLFYFATLMPWTDAFDAAGRAWTAVITTTRFTSNSQQQNFLGFDQVATHLWDHFLGTLWACFFIGFIAAVAWQVERFGRKGGDYFGVILMAALILWLAIYKVNWIASGRCLTGLSLAYLTFCLVSKKEGRQHLIRLLMATLAVAFLARMVLNARIYQFGFYQAALAAILVPAVIIGEFPGWLGLHKKGTGVVVLGTLCLFVPGVVILSGTSKQILDSKTEVVGQGNDRLYALTPEIDPTGDIVNHVDSVLHEARPEQTLLVLPQGLMINCLTRLAGPSVPSGYFHTEEQERKSVVELEAHPPDFVVVISQDLRAYGIPRYGEKSNEGQQLLSWVHQNYTQKSTVGGDPLDPLQHGAIVFERSTFP